jgi:hypothetical protein
VSDVIAVLPNDEKRPADTNQKELGANVEAGKELCVSVQEATL